MLKQRTQYVDECKKNAVKPSYASPRTVRAVADDPSIAVNLLHTGERNIRRQTRKRQWSQWKMG